MSKLRDFIVSKLGRYDEKLEQSIVQRYPVLNVIQVEQLTDSDRQVIESEIIKYGQTDEQLVIQYFKSKVKDGKQTVLEYTGSVDLNLLNTKVLHGDKCIIKVNGNTLSGIWYL